MFMCAIAANLFYGFGIIIRAYSWSVILDSAPWILGSLGTVGLDICIFLQVNAHLPRHMGMLAQSQSRRMPQELPYDKWQSGESAPVL